jgi:hypothetical protein
MHFAQGPWHEMHAWDLVGIHASSCVLLARFRQQDMYPQNHIYSYGPYIHDFRCNINYYKRRRFRLVLVYSPGEGRKEDSEVLYEELQHETN